MAEPTDPKTNEDAWEGLTKAPFGALPRTHEGHEGWSIPAEDPMATANHPDNVPEDFDGEAVIRAFELTPGGKEFITGLLARAEGVGTKEEDDANDPDLEPKAETVTGDPIDDETYRLQMAEFARIAAEDSPPVDEPVDESPVEGEAPESAPFIIGGSELTLMVIGSFAWQYPGVVQEALMYWAQQQDYRITLVTGGCPQGAEAFARDFGAQMGWTLAVARDEELQAIPVSASLAFIRDYSSGAERLLENLPGTVRVFRDNVNGPKNLWIDR